MRIGVDIDGVLANFTDAYAKILTKQTGVKFPKLSAEWPTVWYWEREAGITKLQERAAWKEIEDTHFWGVLIPLPGAIEALQHLNVMAQTGHEVYFITSRPGARAKHLTEMWLRGHGVEYPTVIIAHEKGPLAAALKLDVFIDDKMENVRDVANARDKTRVYIIDSPYNTEVVVGDRVKDVMEVLIEEGIVPEPAGYYEKVAA